jgi:hypothetical protein
MPITPEDFFAAALALNRLEPPPVSDEVCARTMAGRIYYAAYLATREAIRQQLGKGDFDVSHTALVAELRHARDEDVREVGARLRTLKRLRDSADYKPHCRLTKLSVALRMRDARFVLDEVGKLRGRFPQIPSW